MGSEPLTVAWWFAIQSSRADASARGVARPRPFPASGRQECSRLPPQQERVVQESWFRDPRRAFPTVERAKQNPDLLSLIGRRTLCPGGTRRKNHQYCKDRQSSAHGSLLYCFLVHSS